MGLDNSHRPMYRTSWKLWRGTTGNWWVDEILEMGLQYRMVTSLLLSMWEMMIPIDGGDALRFCSCKYSGYAQRGEALEDGVPVVFEDLYSFTRFTSFYCLACDLRRRPRITATGCENGVNC